MERRRFPLPNQKFSALKAVLNIRYLRNQAEEFFQAHLFQSLLDKAMSFLILKYSAFRRQSLFLQDCLCNALLCLQFLNQ